MKNCELCKLPAKMYCESDLASLCWDCDAKVHGANFLVERHVRSLLCHACQSPTPWKASGSKLGHTFSVCQRCVGEVEEKEEREGGNDDDEEIDGEDDVDDHQSDSDDDDDVEDGDNQVVPPWSSSTPPPPASSSSSSEDSSSRFSDVDTGVSDSVTLFSLKRKRQNASDLRLPDDQGCSSSQRNNGSVTETMAARTKGDGETSCVDSSFRPLKGQKTDAVRSGSKSTAMIESSLRRFHRQDTRSPSNNASDLSEETRAVDVDCSDNPGRSI